MHIQRCCILTVWKDIIPHVIISEILWRDAKHQNSRVTFCGLNRIPTASRKHTIKMVREESLAELLKRDTTSYLCYLLFIATLGPLQFGFHLVGSFYKPPQMSDTKLTLSRLSSTLRKTSSHVLKSPSCRPVCAQAFRNVSQ